MLLSAAEEDDLVAQINGNVYLQPGPLYVATSFEDHMSPEIEWLANPEFDEEFDRLMAEQEKRQMAAHTNVLPDSFPAFINIRFEDGNAVVTMRGEPVEVPATAEREGYTKAGETVEAVFPQHDWDQFVSEATRERGLVPGG